MSKINRVPEPKYECDDAWTASDVAATGEKKFRSSAYHDLPSHARDRERLLAWEKSLGRVAPDATWSFCMYFAQDAKNAKNFYASSTRDEIVLVLVRGDRCFPRLRYQDSEMTVDSEWDDPVSNAALATQFAGKGKNARDEFDSHAVLDVPRERPSVAHAVKVFDARRDVVRVASSSPREAAERSTKTGNADVCDGTDDATRDDSLSLEDKMEAMRRRIEARRGKVPVDVVKKRETPEAPEEPDDDDDDDRDDDDDERVVTPRSRLNDSPRARSSDSSRSSFRSSRFSPTTTLTEAAANERGYRDEMLVASMIRLGVRSPTAHEDRRFSTTTPTTPTTPIMLSNCGALSPRLERAHVHVPAVHRTPDEWREMSGDVDLKHYFSLVRRGKDDDAMSVVPRFRAITWKDLVEEDDARLLSLRRKHDWNQDAHPSPVDATTSNDDFPHVGESVRVVLKDITDAFSASIAALVKLTGPPAAVSLGVGVGVDARRAIVLSVVDGKIARRDVELAPRRDADQWDVDDTTVARVLSAFPGTTRVFDGALSELSKCSASRPPMIATAWSRGRPVFWALGTSCVFFVDDRNGATTVRSNFDFSSYSMAAGERFELRGKLVDRDEDEDGARVFCPTHLTTETFTCRVTRHRAYRGKRRLDLALAPPFARRPLQNPRAIRTRHEKTTSERSVDVLTCRDFVSRVMRAYAPLRRRRRSDHGSGREQPQDGWSDGLTGELWDPITGPLVWLALTLGEEDLVDVAETYGGEVANFARVVLRSPWLRTKNECDARRGRCVPLGVTTEFVEMEAGFDDSLNGWKTSLGLRSFAERHHVAASDCAFSSCVSAQSALIADTCGHDDSYHFHEIRRCECARQFSKVCVCDDGQVVKTSLCPTCGGYAQNAYDKIPAVCEECAEQFHGRTPTTPRTPRTPRTQRNDRATPIPLARRRAVMYSKCGHPACVRDKKRVTFECPCGRGSALASKMRDRVAEFVDDVQSAGGIVFSECRVAVITAENDAVAERLTSSVARVVRESASEHADVAFRVVRTFGNASTATKATSGAGSSRVDFVVFVASNDDQTTDVDSNEKVFVFDVRGDEEASFAALRKATRDALCARVERERLASAEDADRDDVGVRALRERESRGARVAARPYESFAPNAEWRVESFTWTSLVGTYVAGKKHRRCAHKDCSLDGAWPVGVVGMDDACSACGIKGGPTTEHDEPVNAEHVRGVPKTREDVHTMLRLVLCQYY